ncbi:hypothetical protein NPIL_560271 [Nephila pilipes]|uniref:Uncharacterized protein n=1 Tax=Nephila pilipes TaxID=299642 RepID=A0A8X6JP89_NEPPI|nr:hypothetical protein NPIL_560271 [Nephila pilipes]
MTRDLRAKNPPCLLASSSLCVSETASCLGDASRSVQWGRRTFLFLVQDAIEYCTGTGSLALTQASQKFNWILVNIGRPVRKWNVKNKEFGLEKGGGWNLSLGSKE